MINLKKTKEKKELLGDIIDTITLVKMTQVLSLVNFTSKYKQLINNNNLDKTNELKLTNIKKNWKYISQVKIKSDWLYNWITALIIFIRYLYRKYNNKKVIKKMKIR